MVSRPILSFEDMTKASGRGTEGGCPSKALHEDGGDDLVAYDDLTRGALDPKFMTRARKDEIEYFR